MKAWRMARAHPSFVFRVRHICLQCSLLFVIQTLFFTFSETRYLAEQERLLSGEIKRMPKFPLIDTPWVDHQDEVWSTFAFLRFFSHISQKCALFRILHGSEDIKFQSSSICFDFLVFGFGFRTQDGRTALMHACFLGHTYA
jgi:hypothetical protein